MQPLSKPYQKTKQPSPQADAVPELSISRPISAEETAVPIGMPLFLQRTSLKVSHPTDADEIEAERVAGEVMRMPDPSSQPLHRCACGGMAEPDGECATCKAKRLGLQRKSESNGGMTAPLSVHQTLRSSGQPLDVGTRTFMESRFGQDFGGVRIHTDSQAAQSAADVHAHAYTVGQNIVFGVGQNPSRGSAGQKLLAHELTHVIQQHATKTPTLRRQPNQPPPTGITGGTTAPSRVVYIDANIIIQINRGNVGVANALRQMRNSGVEIRIAPFQYNELVTNPQIPRTATAQRLMLEEMNIRQGVSPSLAQRVDVNLAGQTGAGGNIMQIRDQQLMSSARADGRNVEIWSLDTPFTSSPRQVESTYGVRVAAESQLPVATGRPDYRVGRQLLGLEAVQISLLGQVTRGTPSGGGGGGTTPGGTPPVAPSPGGSTTASASPGARVVAGGVGIIIVLNEILGGVNRVRAVQQNNIDMGNAHLAFWERFGARPTRGVWDQNGQHPLPPETTPSTSVFGSPSFPYVVDISVDGFRSGLPRMIDSYQDFLYFLDAVRTLHTIEEDPPMPSFPNREERAASRRYYAWVNWPDRANRHCYDITDIITQVRNAALRELDVAMREQTQTLTSDQRGNVYRLKNGADTWIYRSAGGGQRILSAQQVFGPDPWVRTIGRRVDVGGWFSTDIRALVVPANADAQRSALVSAYWVKQSIEDTLDEVREGGRQILDRQPPEGRLNSFVAGPEPGSDSRFGDTRYYRHPDPNMLWTVAIGELRQFWVKASELEPLSPTELDAYRLLP